MRSFILIVCVLVSAEAWRTHSMSRKLFMNKEGSSEKKSTIFDLFNGNAQVKSFKAANPEFFSKSATNAGNKKIQKVKISPSAEAAIAIFRKSNPSPRKGGPYDVEDNELAVRFNTLSTIFKSEIEALATVQDVPDVLIVGTTFMTDNFAVFESKWGFEKAAGVVRRNPNILQIATTGYGSAEVAGDETVVLSYIIGFTRPYGAILLSVLFLALLKPFVGGF